MIERLTSGMPQRLAITTMISPEHLFGLHDLSFRDDAHRRTRKAQGTVAGKTPIIGA